MVINKCYAALKSTGFQVDEMKDKLLLTKDVYEKFPKKSKTGKICGLKKF